MARPKKTSFDKLKDYAKANDIQFSEHMDEGQLLAHINMQMNQKLYGEDYQPEEARPVREVIRNTKEDIIAAIKPIADKHEGFKAKFDDDGCWTFKFGLKEESGTMHQPIERIVRIAQTVVKPALVPRQVKDGNVTTILI